MLAMQGRLRLAVTMIVGLLTLMPITVLGSPQTAQNVFEINQMLKPGLGCDDALDNDGDGQVDGDDPDCTSGGAEARPDPWDSAYRWWVKIDVGTWHVELIGPATDYIFDEAGYIVDWRDMYVNNIFSDGAGTPYAFDGNDADFEFSVSEDRMNETGAVAQSDFLWGTWDTSTGGDHESTDFDDGIPYTLNVNALLLDPVGKYLHPDFDAETRYYAYTIPYEGDKILVNSDGDILNLDTGEFAEDSTRTDGGNLFSDVFCAPADIDHYDDGYHAWRVSDTLAFLDDGDDALTWDAANSCWVEDTSPSHDEVIDDCGYVVATTDAAEADRFYAASGQECDEFGQYQADTGYAGTGVIVEYEVSGTSFEPVVDHELTFDPLILNWFVNEADSDDWDDMGLTGMHRVGNTIYAVLDREDFDCGDEDDWDCDGVSNTEDDLPLDVASSVDADGDGWPDSFNAAVCREGDCNASHITTSGVDGLDEFLNNPNEWRDSDGDGTGDNADCYPEDSGSTACPAVPVSVNPTYLLGFLPMMLLGIAALFSRRRFGAL